VVWEIASTNHEIQVARLLDSLGQPETPRLRLTLGAWLAFVEEVARESVTTDVGRAEIIRLCLDALRAVTGLALPVSAGSPFRMTGEHHDGQPQNDSNKEKGS
jgi:hypothetical protein